MSNDQELLYMVKIETLVYHIKDVLVFLVMRFNVIGMFINTENSKGYIKYNLQTKEKIVFFRIKENVELNL